MPTYRALGTADQPALERFLATHADSSMLLRSNLHAAGIVDRGEPFQGTYFAALDDSGGVMAVLARYWNGNIVCQAPQHAFKLGRAAAYAIDATVSGILGPWEQTQTLRAALGFEQALLKCERREVLYALPLRDLVVPPNLLAATVRCRRSHDDDLEQLVAWNLAFRAEAICSAPDEESCAYSRNIIEHAHQTGNAWLLETDAGPVAMSLFNAALPDSVQVGGVWTPPEHRRKGYARAVVAGSLISARAEGVSRAILFADNAHAQRAYEAIGFRPIGNYAIVFFATAQCTNS